MKKSDQRRFHNSKVTFDIARNVKHTKTGNESKVTSKQERLHTSRVKFKDTGISKAKSVQFVRNTVVPARKNQSAVSFTPSSVDLLSDTEQSDNIVSSEPSGSNSEIKLDVPELCTSLKFANKLLEEAVSSSKAVIHSQQFDGASSANTVKSKVLRKINIPFDEQIYKDLVDLRVTDSDLFPDQERRLKSKQFVRNKEKEPDLSDFYKPSFNQEFIIKAEKIKIEPEKNVHYNGFSISDRSKRWKM